MQLEARELDFVRENFSKHYSSKAPRVENCRAREFGFGIADKIDYRHKAFASQEAFADFLRKEAPLYCSYSTALYEMPEARPMEKKGVIGYDLVFDLDALTSHEGHNKLFCRHCVEQTRTDALRLCEEFLFGDFGFSKNELFVNFSGSKGFHLHLRGSAFKQLSQNSRRQISEYITGEGVKVSKVIRETGNSRDRQLIGPLETAGGWGEKVFSTARDLVLSSSTKELKELGVKPSAAKKIGENKETQLGLISRGNWTSLEGAHEGIVKKTILEKAVVVDKGVTIDSSKLIRVPDSLHGDTGLLAKTVSLGELEKFEPEDAIAFGKEHGNARVKITLDSVLELGEDTVELKENDVLELPLFAVILLLCKGKAVLT